MRKIKSVVLSVIAIIISLISIIISISAVTMVKIEVASLKEKEVINANEVIETNENEVTKTDDNTDQQMAQVDQTIEDYLKNQETQEQQENTEVNAEETQEQQEEQVVEEEQPAPVFSLSEEERAKRREEQQNIYEARQFLYSQPHSVENARKINQLDQMLIANNACNFTEKSITFVGDSISVGIGASQDENGNYRGYVSNIAKTFPFKNLTNNSTGGWLYSNISGDEYSIVANMDSKINISSDILVFYAGVNDYLTSTNDKRFGTYAPNTRSTAGFCGAFEELCSYVDRYLSDREIFVVLSYPISEGPGGTYQMADTEAHNWSDYMNAEKTIASKYNFHIIDLYSTGLLDGTNADMRSAFQDDMIHPNDEGHRLIGEHIAAEISYTLRNKW